MYLHLGKAAVVRCEDIVAICDLDTSSHSHITREFLKKTQSSSKIVNIVQELPKSFIVCQEASVCQVYLSQLSSVTLLKRNETGSLE